MNHPRIGMYGHVAGDGFPYIVNGSLDQQRIANAAKWDDLILDLGCADAHPEIVPALRAANPSIRLHAYVVLQSWNNPNGPAFFQKFWQIMMATNGFLTCTNGKWWSFMNINVANRATMDALAGRIILDAQDWDGIFVDLLIPQLWSATQYGGEVLDWRGMGFASEQAFLDAWKDNAAAFVQKLKMNPRGFAGSVDPPLRHTAAGSPRVSGGQESGETLPDAQGSGAGASPTRQPTGAVGPLSGKLGAGDSASPPPFIVTTNYGTGFPGVADGNMYEEFSRDWKRWIESTMEGELHLGFPAAWITSAPAKNASGHYDPALPENQRRHRYGLATACLFGGLFSFGRYEGDKRWNEARVSDPKWFPKDLSHPQRGKGWLGEERGAVTAPLESGLWARNFEHGTVLVNPTAAPITYRSNALLRPIGGAAKRAWSVPARDGMLLERAADGRHGAGDVKQGGE